MTHGVAKVAISMPRGVFRSVEQARKKLKMARSEAVVEALEAWLKGREEEEMVRQYVEGYRRHPESKAEAKAWTRIAARAFHKDPPW